MGGPGVIGKQTESVSMFGTTTAEEHSFGGVGNKGSDLLLPVDCGVPRIIGFNVVCSGIQEIERFRVVRHTRDLLTSLLPLQSNFSSSTDLMKGHGGSKPMELEPANTLFSHIMELADLLTSTFLQPRASRIVQTCD